MESTLWMGDIEPWMTHELIKNSFIEYGLEPSSIKMIRDHKYNITKNYCFINFETIIEANKAIIKLNGKLIPKTNINFRLNWANKHCEMNRNLYIGNLPNDIDDIQLFNIFKEKYSSVHHVSIMTENGISKGYGFIQFTDQYDYDNCLKEMDGYIIKGKHIIIRERIKKKKEKNENNMNSVYKYNKLNINNIKRNIYKNNNLNKINRIKNQKENGYFYIYNKKQYKKEGTNNKNEEDKNLFSSNSNTNNSEKRKFSDNLDLIENDDHNALNKKIQESVDKMFEQYKYFLKNNKQYNMIIYYSSNKCSFSDNFYFQTI